jgi:hypothetical protein
MKSHFLGCSEEDAILLAKEVRRTWIFLFQPSRMYRQSRVRRAYRRLPLPPWLTTYFGQKSTVGDILDSKQAQYYPEILSHQHKNHFRYNYFKKGGFQYSMCPIFESRVRELREYIDESRPRSFPWRFERYPEPRSLYDNSRRFYACVYWATINFVHLDSRHYPKPGLQ